MNASQLLEVATEVSAETKTPDRRRPDHGGMIRTLPERCPDGDGAEGDRQNQLTQEVGVGPVHSLPPKGSLEKRVSPMAGQFPGPGGGGHVLRGRCQPTRRPPEAPEDALGDYGEEQARPGSILSGPREPMVRMAVGAQATDSTVDTGADHSVVTQPFHRDRPPLWGGYGRPDSSPFLLPQRCHLGGHQVIHESQVTFTSHGQVALTLGRPEARIMTFTVPQGGEWRLHRLVGRPQPGPERPFETPGVWAEDNPPGRARNVPPVLGELRPGTEPIPEKQVSRPDLKDAFFFTRPAPRSQLVFAFQWENPENGTQAHERGLNLCLGEPLPRKQSSWH